MSKDRLDDCNDKQEDNMEDLVGKYIGSRNMLKQRHGKGWAVLPNGDQYDGDYRKGTRHGIGLYVFKNGSRYLGRYRCGEKFGNGKFFYPDGSIYDGNWKHNLRHGQGTYFYANGDIYKGNWYKGMKHSLGYYLFKGNNVKFHGTWNHGIPVGPMELHFQNYKYNGNWDFQYPQGPGTFTFLSKYMVSGYYKSECINIQIGKELTNVPIGEKIVEENESENICEENSSIQIKTPPDILKNLIPSPLWYSQKILIYSFEDLPQQPIPLPLSDSENSVCDQLSEENEDIELPLDLQSFELEDCNVECEQNTTTSQSTSTDGNN